MKVTLDLKEAYSMRGESSEFAKEKKLDPYLKPNNDEFNDKLFVKIKKRKDDENSNQKIVLYKDNVYKIKTNLEVDVELGTFKSDLIKYGCYYQIIGKWLYIIPISSKIHIVEGFEIGEFILFTPKIDMRNPSETFRD